MVSPLPPDESGIADYTEALVEMLRDQGLIVDTITRHDLASQGTSRVLARLRAADTVVYQIGNHSEFHGWMMPLIAQVPGIVHLHDLVLHHMVVGILEREGKTLNGGYERALATWYPASDVKLAIQRWQAGAPVWDSEDVIRFPLHQPVTALALGVIVHSEYAAQRIASDLPWLPLTVVHQLYPDVAPKRHRQSLKTIALLGGGQPNRRFDWVVEALKRIDSRLQRPLNLEIAGEMTAEVELQLEEIVSAKNVRLIKHGRVDPADFEEVFTRCDLMIALRMPTMGETSAVVMKALQAGVPTVVSDHGWYSELPGCVRKLAPGSDCPDDLARLIMSLVESPDMYEKWAEECSFESYRPAFDAHQAAEQYATILRTQSVLSRFRDRVASDVASLGIDVHSPLSAALQKTDLLCCMRGDVWISRALSFLEEQRLDSQARVTRGVVGAYPYTSALPEQAYRGSIRIVVDDLGEVEPSKILSVPVEVINESELPWFSPVGTVPKPYGIYMGHFWHPLDPPGQGPDQPRHHIDEEIEPGVPCTHTLLIKAPDVPGEYILEFDLVHESVCWFRHQGFTAARMQVRVGSN